MALASFILGSFMRVGSWFWGNRIWGGLGDFRVKRLMNLTGPLPDREVGDRGTGRTLGHARVRVVPSAVDS